MNLSDLFALSFANLRRRTGRTLLTLLGTAIGCCSIVVMVSLGIAMNAGFDEMISQWGDLTRIQVFRGDAEMEAPPLDENLVAEIGALDHVTAVTPFYRPQYLTGQLYAGSRDRYQATVELVGVEPQAIEELGYTLLSGTGLDAADSGGRKIPVVMGQNTGYSFVDTRGQGENAFRWPEQTDAAGNPIAPFVAIDTDRIRFETAPAEEGGGSLRYELEVVGVLREETGKGYLTSQGVLIEIDRLRALERAYLRANGIRAAEQATYTELEVQVDDLDHLAAVETAIQTYGYQTSSTGSEREQLQQQGRMLQLTLGGIGAVSLVVAALSIANTMTMAIYERTREIGVMKVLGCSLGRLRALFLIEAGMIGFAGGLAGLLASYLISFALNRFGPALQSILTALPGYSANLSVIPPWLAALGLLFSTMIGLLSGLLPANRAVRIPALEALQQQ